MSLLVIGGIVKAVAGMVGDVHTSDEEELELKLEIMKAEREYDYKEAKLIADQNIAQTEVNKAEAQSGSLFVAGWRPAIGWTGALALFYQFIVYPLLLWLPVADPPPQIEADTLYTIITGMLGIAGMRSFDKMKQTDTKEVK